MKNFEVLSNPREIYRKMLEDIRNARKSIYLESYIYDDDKVGRAFRREMERKASEGVEVKVIVDAWGSSGKKEFFENLKEKGGEIRFFREFKYAIRIFSKNQERNHRKLLLIDSNISYVGSINITEHGLDWRELVLRIKGELTWHFEKSFLKFWETKGKISIKRINKIIHRGFEIIQDTPSKISKPTERSYVKLINKSKKKVMIETPYFIPSRAVRKALRKAARRGVEVEIIVPWISDIKIIDVLRESYLGRLWKAGVYIYYYRKILHSKMLIIDDDFFMLGSSNLDYRSFIHNYDINVIGSDKEIIRELIKHFNESLRESECFDFERWRNRGSLQKLGEILISLIRRYL